MLDKSVVVDGRTELPILLSASVNISSVLTDSECDSSVLKDGSPVYFVDTLVESLLVNSLTVIPVVSEVGPWEVVSVELRK